MLEILLLMAFSVAAVYLFMVFHGRKREGALAEVRADKSADARARENPTKSSPRRLER